MTDIEAKALAMVNEVLEGKALNNTLFTRLPTAVSSLVLLRAIEQHEAYKQQVSDAVEYALDTTPDAVDLRRFIIPKPKPDPLAEAMIKWFSMKGLSNEDHANNLRTALEARGLEIKEISK